MKKLLLCVLIFLCFTGIFAQAIFSLNGSTFVTTINDGGLSYYLSIKEGENGFSLSAPPVFSFNKNGTFLGEIRPSGLFSHILNPSLVFFDNENTKPFAKITNPSLNPGFIGFAHSFKHGNLAFFNPVGLYADMSMEKTFAGILFQYGRRKLSQEYMPNWEDTESSDLELRTIMGYNDSMKKGVFTLNTSAFVIEMYKFGLSGTLGWNEELFVGPFGLKLLRRFDTTSSETPMSYYGYSICLHELSIGYAVASFYRPVYGGTSQKRTLEFSTSYKTQNLELSVVNKTTGEQDFGMTSTTLYSAKYKLENIDLSADFGINRIKNSPITVNKLTINCDMLNAKFCISGTKFIADINFAENVVIFGKNAEFKLTLNQDRACSISLRVN